MILSFGLFLPSHLKGQKADSVTNHSNKANSGIDSTINVSDTLQPDTTKITQSDTLISPSALESTVKYKAKDSVQFKIGEKTANLFDQAKIHYKEIQMTSGKILMDWGTNTIHARGLRDSTEALNQKPVFQEKQQKFEADSMDYNYQSKKGKLYGLQTQKAQGYLHGEEVKKDQYNVTYASKAKYTTCDKSHPHFYIEANKIKTIPNDKIISGPAHLVIGDVPLPLYLPFGFFPNTKKHSSGLILPSYGEDPQRGFFLKGLGYYFAINDKMDLKLEGNIFSKGSWRLRGESNYKNRYQYQGRLALEYGVDKIGEPTDPNFSKQKAFLIKWNHRQAQKARPFSNFRADVSIASNDALNRKIGSLDKTQKNLLNSSIDYSTQFPGTPFQLSVSSSHSQNLADHSFNVTLPSADLQMSRVNPFPAADKSFIKNIGIDYQAGFKNRLQTKDTSLFQRQTWQQWNNGIRHQANFSTSAKVFKYFSFSPNISYRESFFFEKEARQYDPEQDTTLSFQRNGFFSVRSYNFNSDLSTNIYGTFNINKLGILAARHVINPRLNFTYSPDFRDPRFNNFTYYKGEGGEQKSYFPHKGPYSKRPGRERGSLGITIDNNLEMKVKNKSDSAKDTKKVSILDRFTISTNYNFLADSFPLNAIRFNANTRILEMIDLNLRGSIDPYYLDPNDTNRVNRLSINENGKLGRVTNLNVRLSTSLNPKLLKNGKSKPMHSSFYRPLSSIHYVDFDIPWDLRLNYNLNYSKPSLKGEITRNNLGLDGDIKLTDKWKIRGQTSFNFSEGEFAPSEISIHRDLHCWEMSFRWQPFVENGFYMFRINAKSSVLKDLEYEKKKQNY